MRGGIEPHTQCSPPLITPKTGFTQWQELYYHTPPQMSIKRSRHFTAPIPYYERCLNEYGIQQTLIVYSIPSPLPNATPNLYSPDSVFIIPPMRIYIFYCPKRGYECIGWYLNTPFLFFRVIKYVTPAQLVPTNLVRVGSETGKSRPKCPENRCLLCLTVHITLLSWIVMHNIALCPHKIPLSGEKPNSL